MDLKKYFINYSKIFFIMIFILIGFFLLTSVMGPGFNALADDSEGSEDENEFDTIIINNQEYEKDRKGPVPFPHKKHARENNLSCWECHHEYDNDGKNEYSPWGETEKCSSCHDPSTADGDIMKLQTAYHVNCKTCHEEMKIFGDEPFVYRKCNKCHEKTD